MISEELRNKARENKQKLWFENSKGKLLIFLSKYEVSFFEMSVNQDKQDSKIHMEGGYNSYLREGEVLEYENEEHEKAIEYKQSNLVKYRKVDEESKKLAQQFIMSLGELETEIKMGIFSFINSEGKKSNGLLSLQGFKSYTQTDADSTWAVARNVIRINKKLIFFISVVCLMGLQVARFMNYDENSYCQKNDTEFCKVVNQFFRMKNHR